MTPIIYPKRLIGAAVAAGAIATAAPVFAHDGEVYADLAERVSPAVVNIFTTTAPKTAEGMPGIDGMPDMDQLPEQFREFMERFGFGEGMPGMPHGGPQGPRNALGSGFVMDENGYVITNNHVVEGADEVKVRFPDDSEYPAEIVGLDAATDLALLKIEADDKLPFVELGDSDAVRPGEEVMAVGNPFGLGGTVTTGIVSAVGRDINAGPYVDFIQTDAAINRGNSGGPLFDLDGNVIGVNSAIYSPTGTNVGVGFAIPSNVVERVVADLKETGGGGPRLAGRPDPAGDRGDGRGVRPRPGRGHDRRRRGQRWPLRGDPRGRRRDRQLRRHHGRRDPHPAPHRCGDRRG